ncbi:MAG: LptE family protein [Bacteroidota bacterium]
MKKLYLFFLPIFILCNSCGIYSFTGASIPEGAKTTSVKYFQNNAPIVQPLLAQTLTEGLQNKLSSQTKLNLVDKNGDLSFEGTIKDYSITPMALQANETAAKNRLTITISVKFVNKIDEKMNYETNFSRFADYDRNKSISQVEEELITEITKTLIDDIFNRAVVNW